MPSGVAFQSITPGVALVIGLSVADSPCLFFPQGVGDGGIQLHPAPVHAEIRKNTARTAAHQMEQPLVFAGRSPFSLPEVGVSSR